MTTTFDFIKNPRSRAAMEDAYNAITNLDMWDWIKLNPPPRHVGYMFWSDPNLDMISGKLTFKHSGASFGCVMRQMQQISKHGLEQYKHTYCLSHT